MRTTYDPEADAFYAQFAAEGTQVAETREVAPGVFIDLDDTGNLIGMEVLSVRLRSAGTPGKVRLAEAST
jgi:uncharacterized protein YuzE